MSGLFRDEAVQHSLAKLDGEVFVNVGNVLKIYSWLASILIIIGLTIALTAEYDRRETVTGWIVPHAGVIRMVARGNGVLLSIPVREGEWVSQGHSLGVVRSSTATNNADNGAYMEDLVKGEISTAEYNEVLEANKLKSDVNQLQSRLATLNYQRSEIKNTIDIIKQKYEIAKTHFEQYKKINENGFLSRKELDNAKSALLSLEQELSSENIVLLSTDSQITELERQLHDAPLLLKQLQSRTNSNVSSLREKMRQVQSSNEYSLLAPVDCKVLAIPVSRDQFVQSGTTVMILTPKNSRLEGEVYIPSRAAGFVAAGNEVRLHFHAFPFQKFGSPRGKILEISNTVLAPNEVNAPGLLIQEPVFRAKIVLDMDYIVAYGNKIPLQPGMLLSADVITDKRSLLEWLLDPIYAIGKR